MALFNLQFYAPAVQTFMPSENLQTHWFYTNYIPLQRTWVHPEKGSRKFPEGVPGILGMFEGKRRKKKRNYTQSLIHARFQD